MAFPCHVPQDTVYFEANASNGYCLSFCSVKRDGDLGANTRTGKIPALSEEDLTAQELVSLLCPDAALICSRLFCKMNLQKNWKLHCPLGLQAGGAPGDLALKGFWESPCLILMDTCLNYHQCKIL